MLKPTTVRVSEEFLEELTGFIKEARLDRSAYLREILEKGFKEDREERLLARYRRVELSAGELCSLLGITLWDLLELLKKRDLSLNVSLEDWIDAKELG